jgi:1,4-alpha-glucan branching enzyme
MSYAFSENYVLPLSHDEVVHGKGSLMNKLPGDDWQKFANLRLLYGYMYGMPGKKLLFMGGEFGQWEQWQHDYSIGWHLTQWAGHSGMQKWVGDLNRLYRAEPALHELDCNPAGFAWIDCNDADSSAVSFVRNGQSTGDIILVVCNFTPVPRYGYQVGVPRGGFWKEVLNSDSEDYTGSGVGNQGGVEASCEGWHGRPYSLSLTVPPLAAVFLKSEVVKSAATALPSQVPADSTTAETPGSPAGGGGAGARPTPE